MYTPVLSQDEVDALLTGISGKEFDNEDEQPKEREDQLNHIFELQYASQKFNSEKRGSTLPPDHDDVVKRIQASMYFWNCTTLEYEESLSAESWEKSEELVDMLHFILCQFIYLGVTKLKYDLDYFFRMSKTQYPLDDSAYWTNISCLWAQILCGYPHKTWKTYTIKELKTTKKFPLVDISLFERLFENFIGLCVNNNMSKNGLYWSYINKNKENIKRQQKGGKYE